MKGLKLYRRAILAELVEQSMPDIIRARAEQQEEGEEGGEDVEDDDSASWFNLERGSVVTLNSNTMQAKIKENKSNNGGGGSNKGKKKNAKLVDDDDLYDDDDDYDDAGKSGTVQLSKRS